MAHQSEHPVSVGPRVWRLWRRMALVIAMLAVAGLVIYLGFWLLAPTMLSGRS